MSRDVAAVARVTTEAVLAVAREAVCGLVAHGAVGVVRNANLVFAVGISVAICMDDAAFQAHGFTLLFCAVTVLVQIEAAGLRQGRFVAGAVIFYGDAMADVAQTGRFAPLSLAQLREVALRRQGVSGQAGRLIVAAVAGVAAEAVLAVVRLAVGVFVAGITVFEVRDADGIAVVSVVAVVVQGAGLGADRRFLDLIAIASHGFEEPALVGDGVKVAA
jgi:hypothetical protein